MDIFYGVPEPLFSDYLKEREYVHAVCKCPVPNTFSIKIPRLFSSNGKYNFHCNACGTEGVVISKPQESEG